jgi:hypothetical protein
MRFNAWRISVCLAVVGSFFISVNAAAADKTAKPSNLQGTVKMVDKNNSTMRIARGNADREIVYTADTKFMYGHSKSNKAGSVDQVKEGDYISCSGTFTGVKLNATECIYREAK